MSPRKVAIRVVFLAASLLLALAVLEGVARVGKTAPPLVTQWGGLAYGDEHLPWRPKPNTRAKGRNYTDEFDYDYQYNSLGLRDVERPFEKPEGVFRILGLGDSFTHGAGVAFEETFLSRLEAALNARPGEHPRVEVVRAGVGRYFPEPERMMLESYGVRFQPDLVLVSFLDNDIIDTFKGLDDVTVDKSGYLRTRQSQALGSLGRRLYLESHFFRTVLAGYVARQHDVGGNWPDIYKEGGSHEEDWQTVEAEYLRMRNVCREIGAEFVIARIPQIGPWKKHHEYPSQRLAAWAERHGAVFVDHLATLQGTGLEMTDLYYQKDGHMRPGGHEILGQGLARALAPRIP